VRREFKAGMNKLREFERLRETEWEYIIYRVDVQIKSLCYKYHNSIFIGNAIRVGQE
jgi:hypothetical protein